MSNTPPRIAPDLNTSSTVEALDVSKRPTQHHSTSTSASADAEQQVPVPDEEPSSIPLDSIKFDRKGKGRVIPEEEEQDIANNSANYDLALEQEHEHEHERLEQERAQRQRQRYNGEYVDLANDEAVGDGVPGEYPPLGDDEMEERRVQENLKRWEEAEKQRRKAARESYRRSSSSSFGHNTSVVGDVSRKASKIWQDGARRRASLRKGAVKLRDESQSPFDDRHNIHGGKSDNGRNSGGNGGIGGNSSKPSVDSRNSRQTTLSLHESQSGRSVSPSSPTPLVSQNPFHTPRTGSPTSFNLDESKQHQSIPFTPITGRRDSQERGALMEGSSNPPTPAVGGLTAHGRNPSADYEDLDPAYKDRPILQASGSYSLDTFPTQKRTTLPTPKPLDLPRENSPPLQPGRIPSPTLQRNEADVLDDEDLADREARQGRWWTDWLCGCRESGRLGQDQAGRTNPFE